MFKINIKYMIVLLISYVLFFLIGGELFNSIFYVNLIFFIIAIIYIVLGKLFLNIKVEYKEQNYYVGDNLQINIIVKNRNFIPFPYVHIKSINYSRILHLKSCNTMTFKNKIKLNKRGFYNIGNLRVEIKDIFNIFTIKKTIFNDKKIRVYPKVYNIQEFSYRIKGLEKKKLCFLSNLKENTIIRDVRKYEIGDSLKRIHWKLSAKCGELLVKNFEKKHENDINIFLYLSDLTNNKYRNIDEEVVSFFVSLVNYIMNKGVNIRIIISSEENKIISIKYREDFIGLLEYFLGNEYYFTQQFSTFIEKNLNNLTNSIIFSVEDKKSINYLIDNLGEKGKEVEIINYKELVQGENYEGV